MPSVPPLLVPHASQLRPRLLIRSAALAASALALICGASQASAVSLALLRPDPQDLTELRVIVTVRDEIGAVTAFDKRFNVAEVGHGKLEFDAVGVLSPEARISGFEIDFGGPHDFATTIGIDNIPIELSLEEARFHVRDPNGFPISQIPPGESGSIQVPSLDARVAGSVTLLGETMLFDFFGPNFQCDPCLTGSGFGSSGFAPGIKVESFDRMFATGVSADRTGGFFLPRVDNELIGQVDGLSVRVDVTTVVHDAQFVPEPGSALLVIVGVIATAALRRGKLGGRDAYRAADRP